MSYVNLCNINASFPNPQSRSYCNIQISHNQQVFPRCFEVFFLCSSFGSLTLSYILSCNIQSQADLWPPHSSTVFTVTRMFCYLLFFFSRKSLSINVTAASAVFPQNYFTNPGLTFEIGIPQFTRNPPVHQESPSSPGIPQFTMRFTFLTQKNILYFYPSPIVFPKKLPPKKKCGPKMFLNATLRHCQKKQQWWSSMGGEPRFTLLSKHPRFLKTSEVVFIGSEGPLKEWWSNQDLRLVYLKDPTLEDEFGWKAWYILKVGVNNHLGKLQ